MIGKTKKFIEQAKIVHSDKYDYSKSIYIKNNDKVIIVCPFHGEFLQTPHNHLSGRGCTKCKYETMSIKKSCTTKDFIEKSMIKFGDKFNYSKVEYVNNRKKVCIICPIHGEFYQSPSEHLKGGGCPKCVGKNINYEDFIKMLNNEQLKKYSYEKPIIFKLTEYIKIKCPIHGWFKQKPYLHIKGQGCPKCNGRNKTNYEITNEFKQIHGDKYNYSEVNYKGRFKNVCIICKDHGKFNQTPGNHLQGKGCPICNESHLEKEIVKLLDENNIIYERQKHFKWLGRQSLDFYLPDYQIVIECQGEQHFMEIPYWGGVNKLNYVKTLDKNKNKLCNNNNLKIIYLFECENKENEILNNIELYKNNKYDINDFEKIWIKQKNL